MIHSHLRGFDVARAPVRVAALDVGSNAIRYTAAEFDAPDRYRELGFERFAVRLGQDTFTSGVLQPASIEAAVQAGRRFRERMDDLGILRYRAVATSAVRECRNGEALVEAFAHHCSLQLETISEAEEARLVFAAVCRKIDLAGQPWALVDLGGGSMEVSIARRSGIVATESHPLGGVRLIEQFQERAADPQALRARIREALADLSLPLVEAGEPPAGVIVTGGNADVIADLIQAPADAAGVNALLRADLQRTLDIVLGMTMAERISKLGLRKDRADVIVPALIIFDKVAELAGCDRVIVPRVGLKDGMIHELAAAALAEEQTEVVAERAGSKAQNF